MKKNNSFNNDNQFVISYELISLLEWILKHGDNQLKALIKKAMKASAIKKNTIENDISATTMYPLEDIQSIITHFFELVETIIAEIHEEQSMQQAIAQDLLPTIDKVDHNLCDIMTLHSSISKVTSKIEEKPCDQETAKELLFKEILKQWKPKKKNVMS